MPNLHSYLLSCGIRRLKLKYFKNTNLDLCRKQKSIDEFVQNVHEKEYADQLNKLVGIVKQEIEREGSHAFKCILKKEVIDSDLIGKTRKELNVKNNFSFSKSSQSNNRNRKLNIKNNKLNIKNNISDIENKRLTHQYLYIQEKTLLFDLERLTHTKLNLSNLINYLKLKIKERKTEIEQIIDQLKSNQVDLNCKKQIKPPKQLNKIKKKKFKIKLPIKKEKILPIKFPFKIIIPKIKLANQIVYLNKSDSQFMHTMEQDIPVEEDGKELVDGHRIEARCDFKDINDVDGSLESSNDFNRNFQMEVESIDQSKLEVTIDQSSIPNYIIKEPFSNYPLDLIDKIKSIDQSKLISQSGLSHQSNVSDNNLEKSMLNIQFNSITQTTSTYQPILFDKQEIFTNQLALPGINLERPADQCNTQAIIFEETVGRSIFDDNYFEYSKNNETEEFSLGIKTNHPIENEKEAEDSINKTVISTNNLEDIYNENKEDIIKDRTLNILTGNNNSGIKEDICSNKFNIPGNYLKERFDAQISENLSMINQHLSKDNSYKVYADLSTIHGIGLFAKEFIKSNTKIIEYVGEIIGNNMADKRESEYQRNNIYSTYLFKVKDDLIIDATLKGNLARFINHSCVPNCKSKIENDRVFIISTTEIKKGEEITFYYNFTKDEGEDTVECNCGHPECINYIV